MITVWSFSTVNPQYNRSENTIKVYKLIICEKNPNNACKIPLPRHPIVYKKSYVVKVMWKIYRPTNKYSSSIAARIISSNNKMYAIRLTEIIPRFMTEKITDE